MRKLTTVVCNCLDKAEHPKSMGNIGHGKLVLGAQRSHSAPPTKEEVHLVLFRVGHVISFIIIL